MKKVVVLISMAAAVAVLAMGLAGSFGSSTPAVYASRLAGIGGAGVTGIQVANLDQTQPANIVGDFYKQGGGAAVQVTGVAPAGGAYLFYLPNMAGLSNGAYAAIISADRQIAAIASTIWSTTGGGATYSNVAPGTDIIVPLAVKAYASTTSIVSIQNTDTSNQATVKVEVFKQGETAAAVTNSYNIAPGTSQTIDFAKDMNSLPNGFLGSLRATSATPIGVQSFVDISNSKSAVYAFEGVPAEAAADTLYVPLIRNNFFGTTGISVVNPDKTAPVQVTVSFKGSAITPSCGGQTYSQGPVSIAAGSSAVFYQAPVNIPGTGTSPLPDKCLGGAVIKATGGKVLAIVNDANASAGTSAAFNAVSSAQAGTKYALPLYRNGQLPNGPRLTTGIQAMNIGTSPANVTLSVKDNTGAAIACGDCTKTIAGGDSYTWYPPTTAGLKDRRGVYGSAFITSDQPLAVIVNDASEGGAPTPYDSQIYNGIKAD